MDTIFRRTQKYHSVKNCRISLGKIYKMFYKCIKRQNYTDIQFKIFELM